MLVTVTHTVLPTIISGFLCSTVPLFPCILAWINEALVLRTELCQCLARGVVSVVVLIKVYGKLDIVDHVVFGSEEDRWVYRYHVNRKLLMFLDRVFDILAFGLFILYYLKSIPYWPVCFVICILSRLISSALYSNTKIQKCYAVRTILPTILSILYVIVLWTLSVLACINKTLVILPFCMLFAMIGSYILIFLAVCDTYS